MASGSPASFRWGRKEFGWSQRPGQDTQVVGCYAFRYDRSFVHAEDFATAPGRTLPTSSPWAPFCRDFRRSGGQHRVDERERDLGPRTDTRLEDELVRRVRAAAEGPEAVHRERDRRREMARIARSTPARADDRPADGGRGALEQR